MTTLKIKNQQENVSGSIEFEKEGNYSITASYNKNAIGTIVSMSVNVSYGEGKYASYNQSSQSDNANISMPRDVTEEDRIAVSDIFKQVVTIITSK